MNVSELIGRESVWYTTFTIPKGGGGRRTITAPIPPLKAMQTKIYKAILRLRIPPGPFLHAHVRRRSTVTNARALQVKNSGHYRTPRFLVKIDIKDFFPSLTREVVLDACRDECVPETIIALIESYCFREVDGEWILPQGAPTSPILSNLVMKQVARRMGGLIRRWNRENYFVTKMAIYCDNISFASDSDKIRSLVFPLQRILAEYGLKISWKKYEHHSPPARKLVCGVVMDSNGEVLSPPKEYWRKLRAMIHNAYVDLKTRIAPPGKMLTRDARNTIREFGKRSGKKGIVGWEHLGKRVFRIVTNLNDNDFLDIPWNTWRGQISYVMALNPSKGQKLREMLDRLEDETKLCLSKQSSKSCAYAAGQ